MSFVLGLIILVAACTVIATLIMVVLEKKKEIALLKALGAKNDAILRIFLYQGGIIGVAGTALGRLPRLACRAGSSSRYRFPLDPKVYFISQPARSRSSPLEFVYPGRSRHRDLPPRDHPAGRLRRAAAPVGRPAGRMIPLDAAPGLGALVFAADRPNGLHARGSAVQDGPRARRFALVLRPHVTR